MPRLIPGRTPPRRELSAALRARRLLQGGVDPQVDLTLYA